jgi:hypothetical protein
MHVLLVVSLCPNMGVTIYFIPTEIYFLWSWNSILTELWPLYKIIWILCKRNTFLHRMSVTSSPTKSIGPRAGVIYSWLYIQQHTAGFSIGSRTSYGRSRLLSLFSSWKCMNYVFAAGLIFNINLLQIKL